MRDNHPTTRSWLFMAAFLVAYGNGVLRPDAAAAATRTDEVTASDAATNTPDQGALSIHSGATGREYLLLVDDARSLQTLQSVSELPASLPAARRARRVTLAPAVAESGHLMTGDTLVMELFEDAGYRGTVDRLATNENGTLTVRARIEGFPHGFLVLSTTGNRSLGVVRIPEQGRTFTLVADGGEQFVIEIDAAKADVLDPAPALVMPVSPAPAPAAAPAGEWEPATIDVLVVYTPTAAAWAEDSGGIANVIAQAMEFAQLVHDNSQTLVTMKLVHTMEASYEEDSNCQVDLHRLTYSTSYAERWFDEVHAQRQARGADLVVLLAHTEDCGGVAWQLNTEQGRPENGFSLVRVQQAAWTLTLIHEIGHNLGAGHHFDQLTQPGPGLFPFSAGWRWQGTDTNRYCSVMSYPSGSYYLDRLDHQHVAHFSSPAVDFAGVPTGHQDLADNARTVRRTKHAVARYHNTLNVATTGNGLGSIVSRPAGINCGASCSQSFPLGAGVALTALADAGSVFAGWSGGCSGTGVCRLTMTGITSVVAEFTEVPDAVVVHRQGTGTGVVTSIPAGIDCGQVCSASFAAGSEVTLVVETGAGSSFAGWSGGCTGSGVCTVTAGAAGVVTATFEALGMTFATLAGPRETGRGWRDGPGDVARFGRPADIAVDERGYAYAADYDNHTIRRIALATGEVTTLAGVAGASGSVDGVGGAARFRGPMGLVADGQGNLYVADTDNNTIRKVVLASGEVSTLAGLARVSGGLDGVGAAARFFWPTGVALDAAGNLFIADYGNNTLRRIVLATGEVTTVAGRSGIAGDHDGVGALARFRNPSAVAVDADGVVYVADSRNHTLRAVNPGTGAVTTLAGKAQQSGATDGAFAAARFYEPSSLAMASGSRLLVADRRNQTIREVSLVARSVRTLAGAAIFTGFVDDIGAGARFSDPRGVAVLGGEQVLVADGDNHAIRKVLLATGEVRTLAGSGSVSGAVDGFGDAARFRTPEGVAADNDGHLFVADSANHTVRKVVVATGEVTTLAGAARVRGWRDDIGSAAWFAVPAGLAVDGEGHVFVADSGNHVIRRIEIASGRVTTVAGTPGSSGAADGTGSTAKFRSPGGLATDGKGKLYVADRGNHIIRCVVIATGEVTTVAGTAGAFGSVDGIGSAARFSSPHSLIVGRREDLLVADGSHTIRRVDLATGEVTTLAGKAGDSAFVDGVGSGARFGALRGLAADGGGGVLVADSAFGAIRRIDLATGEVTTVAGLRGLPSSQDGTGTQARFQSPTGLAADHTGTFFVTDSAAGTVHRSWPTLPDRAVIDRTAALIGEVRQLDTVPQTATSWLWEVVRRPAGGVARVVNAEARNPVIFPDAADVWVFRLRADGPGGKRISSVSFTGLSAAMVRMLSVSLAGSGGGTVTSVPAGIDCGAACTASFSAGTVVTLSAVAAPGSAFAGWSGEGCAQSSTCVLTMDARRNVSATFNVTPVQGVVRFAGVASLQGTAGTRWRSEVILVNPGETTRTAALDLIPRDAAAVTAGGSREVPPGGLVRIPDLYTELGAAAGAGMLRVTGNLFAWVRTFNDQGAGGTFGQDVPPALAGEGYPAATDVYFPITAPAEHGAGFRSNLLLLNLESTPITFTLQVESSSATRVVPGGTYTQIDRVGSFLGFPPGMAVLKVRASGSWTGTVSTVDPGSGDPTTVRGLVAPPQDVVLFAGVASTSGAAGTRWRSEAVLFNPGSEVASVVLEILPRGSSVAASSEQVVLQPQEVRHFADLYAELGAADGAGMLRVRGDALSWVRTFNVGDTATFGQDVPPVRPGHGIEAGQEVLYPICRPEASGLGFRTNLLVFNHGASALTITIAAGGRTRTSEVPAGAYVQVNDVGSWLGVSHGWTTIAVSGNGKWSGTVSTIDPTTGDPTTVTGILRPAQ